MNVCELQNLTEPSSARIMRLEIELVGLPGNISEMTTEKLHNRLDGNQSVARSVHIFNIDDDVAIRKMLVLPQQCEGTFLPQINEFLNIRNDFVYYVPGFGAFIKKEDVSGFVEKTNCFNAQLRELRALVVNLLEKRYAGRSGVDDVFYHKFIMRFNPRIKYGIFLLSKGYVADKKFIRACMNSAYKGLSRCRKVDLVPWLPIGKDGRLVGLMDD